MVRWIRTKGSPSLIINGGDVYPDGKTKEFTEFFKQMDNDVSLMCETPGNHDWKDDPELPQTGRIPHGYDTFWRSHPESKQPVDTNKKGGARYEHFIDIDSLAADLPGHRRLQRQSMAGAVTRTVSPG